MVCLRYWSSSLCFLERGDRAQSYWSISLCSLDRSNRPQSCVNGAEDADGLLEEAHGVELSSINSMMSTVMSVSTLGSSGVPSASCTPAKSPTSSKSVTSKSPTISCTARKNPVGTHTMHSQQWCFYMAYKHIDVQTINIIETLRSTFTAFSIFSILHMHMQTHEFADIACCASSF